MRNNLIDTWNYKRGGRRKLQAKGVSKTSPMGQKWIKTWMEEFRQFTLRDSNEDNML